jgi:hypothetical protein
MPATPPISATLSASRPREYERSAGRLDRGHLRQASDTVRPSHDPRGRNWNARSIGDHGESYGALANRLRRDFRSRNDLDIRVQGRYEPAECHQCAWVQQPQRALASPPPPRRLGADELLLVIIAPSIRKPMKIIRNQYKIIISRLHTAAHKALTVIMIQLRHRRRCQCVL